MDTSKTFYISGDNIIKLLFSLAMTVGKNKLVFLHDQLQGATTLRIMKFSIMAFSVMTLMLSAECHNYAHYAECRDTECPYAERHYA